MGLESCSDYHSAMMEIDNLLYSASQIRKIEQRAARQFALDPWCLMQRAGRAAFQRLRARWPGARSLGIVCGPGNNGGDGYVVAALAAEEGLEVDVVALSDPSAKTAQRARQAVSAHNIRVREWSESIELFGEVLVDAVLGTGLNRAPVGRISECINSFNQDSRPVAALDIPSGLVADSGAVPANSINADLTVTFVALKLGLMTGRGPDVRGQLLLDDLGMPSAVFSGSEGIAACLNAGTVARHLPPRRPTSHKGDAGHLLVVGGDQTMSGAARLSSAAALRSGAGLVTLATHPLHASSANLNMPELMVNGISDGSALADLSAGKKAIVIGPGLGRSVWGRDLFARFMEQSLPSVVDADGLNLLAQEPAYSEHWVLTPHPGEAARLLQCVVRDVENDRPGAVEEIQKRYGGTCVLKGAGTLIASGDPLIHVCGRGNPGMASAGMGDLLAGVIGALLVQGLSSAHAAQCGVWLHASAGDIAAGKHPRGLIASDLLGPLRTLVNEPYAANELRTVCS